MIREILRHCFPPRVPIVFTSQSLASVPYLYVMDFVLVALFRIARPTVCCGLRSRRLLIDPSVLFSFLEFLPGWHALFVECHLSRISRFYAQTGYWASEDLESFLFYCFVVYAIFYKWDVSGIKVDSWGAQVFFYCLYMRYPPYFPGVWQWLSCNDVIHEGLGNRGYMHVILYIPPPGIPSAPMGFLFFIFLEHYLLNLHYMGG